MNSFIEINVFNYILNNKYSITFSLRKFHDILRYFNSNLDHLVDKIEILNGKVVILKPLKEVI